MKTKLRLGLATACIVALSAAGWTAPAFADSATEGLDDLVSSVTSVDENHRDLRAVDHRDQAIAVVNTTSPSGSALSVSIVNAQAEAAARSTSGAETLTALKAAGGHGYVTRVSEQGPAAVYIVLDDAEARTVHSFDIHIDGAPAQLTLADGGFVEVRNSDNEIENVILPPWAHDAAGNEVATHYAVSGSTLTQTIGLNGSEVFPVVADPALACSGIFCTVEFNRSETQNIGFFGGIGGAASAACGLLGHVFAVAACIAYVVGMSAWITGTAQQAYNQGDCLGIRFIPGSLASTHPAVYNNANCW